MAVLAKSGTPSLASLYPVGGQVIVGLKAATGGILAGDICYIAADGTATKCNGTAATAPAIALGIAAGDAAAGEAVTLYKNVVFHYGAALTPGAAYYVSATAGALDTAATTGGTVPVARAIDTTRILFGGSN